MMDYFAPRSMDELAEVLRNAPESMRIIAGGTDYVIASRRSGEEPGALVYLGQLPETQRITLTDTELRVGAMVTMARLARELPGEHWLRAIVDAVSDVGSPQIREKATWIGNLCNASPAGDMMPVSLLYDAELETLDGEGTVTRIPVRDFVLAPRKTVLQPRQAVTAVVIDASRFRGCISAFHKIGSRERVSISRIGLAALVRLDNDRTIAEARMTLGAVANTPIRVPEAEERMLHRRLDEDALLTEVTAIVSKTVHDNCRPTNRLYKTEASRGLTADLFSLLLSRED